MAQTDYIRLMRVMKLALFLLACVATTAWQVQNHRYLLHDHPDALRRGVTVRTADDASYLAPVENFLDHGHWRSNAVGDAAWVTRSPGYGLVYLGFRSWLSPHRALLTLVVFQILLFAAAVAHLPRLGIGLGASPPVAFFISAAVAVLPGFSGFLGYTLTEAITPALVIFFLWAILRLLDGSARAWLVGLLLGFLLLVRPALIFWWMAPAVAWLFVQSATRRKLLWVVAVSALPLLGWLLTTWSVTSRWQGLHPIYHADTPGLYRPLHDAAWGFHKMWGQEGVDFHHSMGLLWSAAGGHLEDSAAVAAVLDKIDRRAVHAIGRENLRSVYAEYITVLRRQFPHYLSSTPLPEDFNPAEPLLAHRFREFRRAYVRAHPIHAWLGVPAQVFIRLTAHSNLSMYMFQKPLRGVGWVEGLRWISSAIHFGSFLLFFVGLVVFRSRLTWRIIGWPIVAYLLYLVLVQRGVEERYTLPVLIPVFVMAVLTAVRLAQNLRDLIASKFNQFRVS